MKIGEIIEVEGVQYIAQQEILACRGCYFDGETKIDCYKEYGCKSEDNVIFIEIPTELLRKIEQLEKRIEMMRRCENCSNFVFDFNGYCEKNTNCKNYSEWEAKE